MFTSGYQKVKRRKFMHPIAKLVLRTEGRLVELSKNTIQICFLL